MTKITQAQAVRGLDTPVVNTLLANLPAGAWRHPIALQFTEPAGYWMRVHPGCRFPEVMGGLHYNIAARAAEGGAQ